MIDASLPSPTPESIAHLDPKGARRAPEGRHFYLEVCLRRMAHPAEIGQPARTLLTWKGTKLVCTRGHALLHIPAIPTSWFGVQRWLCLDPSWQFLFAGSVGDANGS